MMDFIPRAFVIRYCDILNNLMVRFFQDHQNFFSRNEDGTYVFSGKNSKTRLTRIFSEYLLKEMESIAKSIEESNKEIATRHVFVLQGVSPENNVLLNQNTGKIVHERYFLVEKDIHMDFALLGGIWDKIFDKRFCIRQIHGRNFGMVFLRHQNLNAEQLENILKLIYGEVRKPYSVERMVLGDIAETTHYEFDGSRTMHDRLKSIVGEVKDYVRKTMHFKE